MTDLKHRVWFVRWTPTKLIQLHPTLDLHLRDGLEWFETLVKDIDKNGLMNPILVHNQTAPCDENTPNRVVHGCNRYRAIRRLGWNYIPTLIVGTLPNQFRKGGATELMSLAEAQTHIVDGIFVNDRFGCKVLNAKPAETMDYIHKAEPYFDKAPV